jgi:hypothetical protein
MGNGHPCIPSVNQHHALHGSSAIQLGQQLAAQLFECRDNLFGLDHGADFVAVAVKKVIQIWIAALFGKTRKETYGDLISNRFKISVRINQLINIRS